MIPVTGRLAPGATALDPMMGSVPLDEAVLVVVPTSMLASLYPPDALEGLLLRTIVLGQDAVPALDAAGRALETDALVVTAEPLTPQSSALLQSLSASSRTLLVLFGAAVLGAVVSLFGVLGVLARALAPPGGSPRWWAPPAGRPRCGSPFPCSSHGSCRPLSVSPRVRPPCRGRRPPARCPPRSSPSWRSAPSPPCPPGAHSRRPSVAAPPPPADQGDRMSLLEVHDVDKTFLSGGEAVPVLRGLCWFRPVRCKPSPGLPGQEIPPCCGSSRAWIPRTRVASCWGEPSRSRGAGAGTGIGTSGAASSCRTSPSWSTPPHWRT